MAGENHTLDFGNERFPQLESRCKRGTIGAEQRPCFMRWKGLSPGQASSPDNEQVFLKRSLYASGPSDRLIPTAVDLREIERRTLDGKAVQGESFPAPIPKPRRRVRGYRAIREREHLVLIALRWSVDCSFSERSNHTRIFPIFPFASDDYGNNRRNPCLP